MPWFSIAVWLITFLLSSSKEGVSTGKAALMATAAGLGAYYLADPANPDNLLALGQGAKAEPGSASESALATPAATKDGVKAAESPSLPSIGGQVVTETGTTVRTLGTAAISEVGKTAQSWGPTGTLGVVAGASVLSDAQDGDMSPWLIAGGVLLAVAILHNTD